MKQLKHFFFWKVRVRLYKPNFQSKIFKNSYINLSIEQQILQCFVILTTFLYFPRVINKHLQTTRYFLEVR